MSLKNIFYYTGKEKNSFTVDSVSYLLCAFYLAVILPASGQAVPLSCFVKRDTARTELFTKKQATYQNNQTKNNNKKTHPEYYFKKKKTCLRKGFSIF